MKVDWLIVGAGFTGCTLAERIASQMGQRVLIVDQRNHIGGNAHDYFDENGFLVHKYGPHIFHTNSKKIWDYLSQFTDWRPYYHRVLAWVDGKKIPVPFNLDSLYAVFPPAYATKLETLLLEHYAFGSRVPILKMLENTSSDLQFLASFIYKNIFLGYTTKQWQLTPEQLDPSVSARVPVIIGRDSRYFQDTYQAMPSLGYTELFQRLLAHPNIRVLLKTNHQEAMSDIQYRRMIYTGAIDAFFDHRFGRLPYRSVRFETNVLDREWHQEVGTVNYPNEYDFTRVTEQKYLTAQTRPQTALVYEYPQPYVAGENDPYYPIPRDENRELYHHYLREAELLDGRVLFAGRLADYRYYNMDQSVGRALSLFEKEIAKTETQSLSFASANGLEK